MCFVVLRRWQRPAVRRSARPSQTCAPTTSASWAPSPGTLSCRTSTATASPSTPALGMENHSPRTARSPLLLNRSSPPPPRGSTSTPEPCSPSHSSFLTSSTGLVTCDPIKPPCIIKPTSLPLNYLWDQFNSKGYCSSKK